jgi:hypothetical protein
LVGLDVFTFNAYFNRSQQTDYLHQLGVGLFYKKHQFTFDYQTEQKILRIRLGIFDVVGKRTTNSQ